MGGLGRRGPLRGLRRSKEERNGDQAAHARRQKCASACGSADGDSAIGWAWSTSKAYTSGLREGAVNSSSFINAGSALPSASSQQLYTTFLDDRERSRDMCGTLGPSVQQGRPVGRPGVKTPLAV